MIRDLLELGLLQVEYTNEEDPDVVAALMLDYLPDFDRWEVDCV